MPRSRSRRKAISRKAVTSHGIVTPQLCSTGREANKGLVVNPTTACDYSESILDRMKAEEDDVQDLGKLAEEIGPGHKYINAKDRSQEVGAPKRSYDLHLEPVDTILDHLLRSVLGHRIYGHKYQRLLDGDGKGAVARRIKESMRAEVRALEGKDFTMRELLQVGGNLNHTGVAIYLHIIEDTEGFVLHWLYIGQSLRFSTRRLNHQDPLFRKLHPSCHYRAWNQPNREETFILLSYDMVQGLSEDDIPLVLNLAEMFYSCWFQTLPEKMLKEFFPNVKIRCPDGHPNLASPLSQAQGRINMSELYRDVMDSWNVYAQQYMAQVKAGYQWKRHLSCSRKQLMKWLEGWIFPLAETNSQRRRPFGNPFIHEFNFQIPLRQNAMEHLRCGLGDNIRILCDIVAEGETHPHPYCTDAPVVDPAKRLGFQVIARPDANGPLRFAWLTTQGQRIKTISKINSFVDFADGRPVEYTENSPRRFLQPFALRGRPQGRKYYTNNDGLIDPPILLDDKGRLVKQPIRLDDKGNACDPSNDYDEL